MPERRQKRRLCALSMGVMSALCACLSCAMPAQAYKIQTTEHGTNVRWYERTVLLHIAPDLQAHFPDFAIDKLVTEAADAWNGVEGVPLLRVEPGPPAALGFQEHVDSNGIYLVSDWKLWPDALAATIATFDSGNGKLVDADVQVNANFAFAWLSASGDERRDRFDLLGVMTHEMGHVLGMADSNDAPTATMWPTIGPGETFQRDLDKDDEVGVEEAYGAVIAAQHGSSCGKASVLGPHRPARSGGKFLLALASLLALWTVRRARLGRKRRRCVIVLAGLLLFGSSLSPASASPNDPTFAPQQKRLAAFLFGAERVLKGQVLSDSAERRAGLIWTHFRVQGAHGAVELEWPGGSLGGFTQVVSGRAPPRTGESVIVAVRKHGRHGWAHYEDGSLYGGSLGEGPALEWN